MAFNAGKPLLYCERQIVSFVEVLESRNREGSLSTLRSLLHLIRNLRNENIDLTNERAGGVVREERISKCMTNVHARRMSLWANYHSAFLCYIFGAFEKAADEIKEARPLALRMFSSVDSRFVVMLDGLIHLTPGRHRSANTARRRIRMLKRESRKAPHQLLHCLYFLQAELAAFVGSRKRAIAKFHAAAAIASESHFHADLANTWERFGDFYARLGEQEASTKYYRRSADAFGEWGATAKVKAIYSRCPALLSGSTL